MAFRCFLFIRSNINSCFLDIFGSFLDEAVSGWVEVNYVGDRKMQVAPKDVSSCSISDMPVTGGTMTTRRENLDSGAVDLSDVTEGIRLPPVHPGDVLKHKYRRPLGMSVYALGQSLAVSRSRINEIVQGHRSVTAETALRLGHFFGTSADFWLGLQAAYDLEVAKLPSGRGSRPRSSRPRRESSDGG